MKYYIAPGRGLCRPEGNGHFVSINGGPLFTVMGPGDLTEVNLFIPYDKSTWPAEGVEVEVWSQYILDRGGSPGQAKIRSGQWVFTRHCGLPIACWRPIVRKWEYVEGFGVWVRSSGGRKGVIVEEARPEEPHLIYHLFINGERHGSYGKWRSREYAMAKFEEEVCM